MSLSLNDWVIVIDSLSVIFSSLFEQDKHTIVIAVKSKIRFFSFCRIFKGYKSKRNLQFYLSLEIVGTVGDKHQSIGARKSRG